MFRSFCLLHNIFFLETKSRPWLASEVSVLPRIILISALLASASAMVGFQAYVTMLTVYAVLEMEPKALASILLVE